MLYGSVALGISSRLLSGKLPKPVHEKCSGLAQIFGRKGCSFVAKPEDILRTYFVLISWVTQLPLSVYTTHQGSLLIALIEGQLRLSSWGTNDDFVPA